MRPARITVIPSRGGLRAGPSVEARGGHRGRPGDPRSARASASRARCHRLRARNLEQPLQAVGCELEAYVFVTERGGPISTIGLHHPIQRPAETAAVAEDLLRSAKGRPFGPFSRIRPGSSPTRPGRSRPSTSGLRATGR